MQYHSAGQRSQATLTPGVAFASASRSSAGRTPPQSNAGSTHPPAKHCQEPHPRSCARNKLPPPDSAGSPPPSPEQRRQSPPLAGRSVGGASREQYPSDSIFAACWRERSQNPAPEYWLRPKDGIGFPLAPPPPGAALATLPPPQQPWQQFWQGSGSGTDSTPPLFQRWQCLSDCRWSASPWLFSPGASWPRRVE